MAAWIVFGVLLASLAVLVSLARAGSWIFWKPERQAHPAAEAGAADATPAHPLQAAAIGLGLVLVVSASAAAGPVADYASATARQLFDRRAYVDAVLGARPVPPAHDVRREMRERGDAK